MKTKFKVYVYNVYRQDPPVFVGKDSVGNDQFRPSIEFVSTVSGTYKDCWDRAYKLVPHPVMEKMSEEFAHVQ